MTENEEAISAKTRGGKNGNREDKLVNVIFRIIYFRKFIF